MEEATGAPSSLADCDPRRLRACGRGGETVMTESPSPLTMLLSRHTKRREFIAGLGGAAAFSIVRWSADVHAQTSLTIGYLSGSLGFGKNLAAFRNALAQASYVEGRNLTIDYRS